MVPNYCTEIRGVTQQTPAKTAKVVANQGPINRILR